MFLSPLFKLMAEKQASDLFISAGAPVSIKILGSVMPVNAQVIDPETARKIAYEVMSDRHIREFEETMEMNFSYVVQDVGRFRVNVFRQRGNVAMVIRYLKSGTPGIDKSNCRRSSRTWCWRNAVSSWWSGPPVRASPPRSPP
jgi:twitching motility protein PilU